MIKELTINGFKCIDYFEFSVKNLTLLTGMNSAGKSTVLQALLILIQSYRNEKKIMPLKGELVNVGAFSDVRNYIAGSKEILISAGIEVDGKDYSPQVIIHENEGYTEIGIIKLKEDEGKEQDYFGNKKIVYLSADRVGAKDVYDKNPNQDGDVGVHCQFAFDYLRRNSYMPLTESNFIKDASVGKTLEHQVNFWLEYLAGYSVKAEALQGTELVKVSYAKRGTNRYIRPINVGTGISYVSAIVISALSCNKGDVIIIENPEIHLHPKAQSLIIEFLAFLSNQGLQVIIETHSDHIYNGVRKAVKSGGIDENLVGVYFFKQDEKALCSPVEIRIDRYGLVDNNVKGLFDQFDDDLDELLGL